MKKVEIVNPSQGIACIARKNWKVRSSAQIKIEEIKIKFEQLLKDLLGAVEDNKRELTDLKLIEENLLFQTKWLKDYVGRIDLGIQELHELIEAEETPN